VNPLTDYTTFPRQLRDFDAEVEHLRIAIEKFRSLE
jgi:hypothetical protein